ncbi:MAG TPA: hypothetical protein VGS02_07585 [Acidobacteriaceae bacterium]|nr:hypothetical protein [Acidobacteriaceae bacterium]
MMRAVAMAGAVLCWSVAALAQGAATDSIDGNWTVTFTVQGQTVSGQMAFHAQGEKLSGTVESAHTGRGILSGGAWMYQKLSGICVFEQHDAIALAGEMRDGKLAGTFETEGMNGTWEATRATGVAGP